MVEPGPVARSDARPPGIRSWVRSSGPAKHSFMEIGHEIISTSFSPYS